MARCDDCHESVLIAFSCKAALFGRARLLVLPELRKLGIRAAAVP